MKKKPTGMIPFNPSRPIAYLDMSWSSIEQSKILAALQTLTDDKLSQNGLEVFADGSGKLAANRRVGEILLRGIQHPTNRVAIVPQTASLIPSTKVSGADVQVAMAFSSGDWAKFHVFIITGANVPGPGGNAIETSPGFIVLAHELVHAFRILRNSVVSGARDHEFYDPSGNKFSQRVSLEELRVIGIDGSDQVSENRIRAEQGLGSREAYASPTIALDQQGVKPLSSTPSWWPDCPTP